MAFSKLLPIIVFSFCVGSLVNGKEAISLYEDEVAYQTLPAGRYEPRRPAQPIVNSTNQRQRFQPTRPNEVRQWNSRTSVRQSSYLAESRSTQIRYQPTRPRDAATETWYETSSSGNDYMGTIIRQYDTYKSIGRDYKQVNDIYSRYEEISQERKRGLKVGKLLFKPVKIAFKVSRKVVTKNPIKWWLPIL